MLFKVISNIPLILKTFEEAKKVLFTLLKRGGERKERKNVNGLGDGAQVY